MAIFEVTSPNGKTLEIEGETQPTEQELEQIFSQYDTAVNPIVETVQNARKAGTPLGVVPTSLEELKDLGKIGLRQFIPDSGGLVGQGARLFTKQTPNLPEPKTEYGKRLEGEANIAQLSVAGVGLSKLVGKTGQALLDSINVVGKDLALQEEARTVASKAKEVFKLWAKNLSDNFGEEYRGLIKGKTITREDYLKSLDELASQEGLYAIEESALSGPQRKIRNYIDEVRRSSVVQPGDKPVAGIKPSGIVSSPNKNYDSVDSYIGIEPKTSVGSYPKSLEKVYVKTSGQSLIEAIEGKSPVKLPDEIPLEQIDDEMKGLLSKSYGKQYGYGEHILSDFRGMVSDIMSDRVEGLNVMKARYAPDLGFKREMFRTLDPYNPSGDANLDRATDFFKKAGENRLKIGKQVNLEKFIQETDPTMLDDLLAKGKQVKTARISDFLAKKAISGIAQTIGAGTVIGAGIGVHKLLNKG